MTIDLTLISYTVALGAISYNLVLFTVWLVLTNREGGHASTVYKIILGLFAVRAYGIYLGINARLLRSDHDAYMDFMDGWMWDGRLVPEAIVFLLLAFVMTKRFVKSYLFNDPEYRAKNGSRKTDKR